MAEFRMPSLGSDMQAGILAQWLVQPGARVQRGDLVAVVETQKGAIDVEVFETGTLTKLLVEPGTEVPVGTPLAYIDTGAAAAPPAPPAAGRPRISPAARKRAQELGVDVEALAVSLGGAVTLDDVERRAGAAAPASPAGTGMRQAIADAMARAKREVPHYYLSVDVDLTALLARLQAGNAVLPLPERLSQGVFLLRATALALKRYPEFNGYWESGFKPAAQVNLGVAVSLRQGGLVAPALFDVDKKDLATLMRELMDLVSRARGGHLRSSELAGPTLTVSSLGEQGVDSVYPIIYPPQVAIVGFGTVRERPWPVEGKVEVRRVITATLAGDHRVSDGHRGARFLDQLRRLLEEPELL